jgi:hypothetical protein
MLGTTEMNTRNQEDRASVLRKVAAKAPTRLARLSIAALVGTLAACGAADDSTVTPNPTARTAPTTSMARPSPPVDELVATTTAPTTSMARPSAPVDELVAVGDGGARLHVRCSGVGDSTVILISGFEGAGDIWGSITPALSPQTRVCA